MYEQKKSSSSICLSEEGIKKVNIARIKKGWKKTQKEWYESAFVSISTLKRFMSGTSISPDSFKKLSEVVGIEDWNSLIDEYPSQSFTHKKSNFKTGVGITGIFTLDKKLEVEIALEHLKQLLINCKVVIYNDDNLGQ
ncbi:MAG: hypothetical protein F6K25_30830 [Okeania sp. SIO2G4]|uniref:hypothetical protein n=1 Tax=unclassified Okeania TaxID=2634635 RepID=UPI0013BCAA57|nr:MULTISPECIES: hypothetical protein [unclassified Okeania]NEP40479.1 hypothetical protein [Okeania sp. SIO2H7]NEP74163.1 hypothetical protein [Okeania sp. SIO2G5]NEP95113.1 hypothetical protein [Okeania sp. SIO2F5]NEQ94792.1 hypothetical protein [Okeania sp. SIO2G4]